jgi:hypothetical protein
MQKILIDGLPRTGTTTLARLFAIHPDTRVIIEPFHPKRYEGRYHRIVLSAADQQKPFDFAWERWNVIKHVWETGKPWPFTYKPALQGDLWKSADLVITANRRNLLKRYVSAEVSRTLGFWIGTRQDFLDRLQNVCLLPLDIERARQAIQQDRTAVAVRANFLAEAQVPTINFVFEDFFNADTNEKHEMINALYAASGLRTLGHPYLLHHATRLLDPDQYQWSSYEVYRAIPNIVEFEAALASEDGSLFGVHKNNEE